MRDFEQEFQARVAFIRQVLAESGTSGIVYGNSGGKDSALVGILCKAACENTVGVMMPCASSSNFGTDLQDAMQLAEQFGIETRQLDLTPQRELFRQSLAAITDLNEMAVTNMAPRLRMITLYAIAASENRLVAGTSNGSERYVGYFTKWGDGACDFNPIADLSVGDVYGFLQFLQAPASIISKPPSGGLFEGQTDEAELGVSYAVIDEYIKSGKADAADKARIERLHKKTAHKRNQPLTFVPQNES